MAAVLASAPARVTAEAPDTDPIAGSLQGRFLVAHPSLSDPRFAHAVVLMVRHDANGAFGLIINRPAGVAEVVPDEPDAQAGGDGAPPSRRQQQVRLPAYLGGPVEPGKAFIIHTTDYATDGTVSVTGRIAVTANAQILNDIADGKGPKRTLYVVGYSGWGAGQLENEMRRNDWYEAPVDDGMIFGGEDMVSVWKQAMEMRLRGI